MADREISYSLRLKDAASSALQGIQGAAERVGETFAELGQSVAGFSVILGAMSFAEVIKEMIDLGTASDATFRQIAANLPTFTEGISELKEGVTDLANASGRSIESMQASAAAIAKMGVGSADELKQQLTAATTLADATGMSVDSSAQLLIQLRREFNLTGDQALETAAKLASAALAGHVGLDDLSAAFARATPQFQKLGIGADEGTRAIVAMVAQGEPIRKIGSIINGLNADGIKQWAAQGHIAADAMQQLTMRSDETRGSIEATNTRIKNEFKSTLEDIGATIGDKVLVPLQGWALLLQLIIDKQSKIDPKNAAQARPDGLNSDPNLVGAIGAQNRQIAKANPAPKSTPPLSDADQKKLDEAAEKLAKLSAEADHLATITEAATPKSAAFAESIGKWASEAIKADMPFGAFFGHLEQLQVTLAKMKQDELMKQMGDDMNEVAKASEDLDHALSAIATGPLAQLEQQFKTKFDAIKKAQSEATGPGDVEELAAAYANLTDQFTAMKAAVLDTDATSKALGVDLQFVSEHLTQSNVLSYLDKWTDAASAVQAQMQQTTDPEVLAEYKKDLDQINAALAVLGGDWKTLNPVVQDCVNPVRQLAEAWDAVSRSVLGAAESVDGVSASMNKALDNLGKLGEGVGKVYSGDVVGGIVEGVQSLAGLVEGFQNHEDPVITAIAQKNIDAMNSLTQALYKVVTRGINGVPTDANIGDTQSAIDVIEKLLASRGGAQGSDRILTTNFVDADAVQEAAKEFGIVIDDTKDGWQMFLNLLLASLPKMQAAQDAFDAAAAKQAAHDAFTGGLSDMGTGFGVLGTSADDQLIQKEAYYAKASPQIASLGDGLDLTNADDIKTFGERLKQFWVDVGSGKIVLDTSTLSIDDWKNGIVDLSSAVTSAAAAFETAAQQMADAESGLATSESIMGTSNVGRAQDLGDLYGFGDQSGLVDSKGNPITDAINQEIADAQKRFKALDKTDPNYSEEAREIDNYIKALRAALPQGSGTTDSGTIGATGLPRSGATSAITSSYAGLTTLQGDRLSDLELRQVGLLGTIAGNTSLMVARLNVGSFSPVNLASAGAAFAGAAGGAASAPLIGSVEIKVVTDKENAADIGTQVADAFVRELDVKFGRKTLVQKLYNGDISQ